MIDLKTVERLELGRLVTPTPDRNLPVYRWFLAKESFSRGLVIMLARTWGLERGSAVLDPFCGAGTTLLACRELGIDSLGYDVHPMMLFASRVKLAEYDGEALLLEVRRLLSLRYENVDAEVPGLIRRVFHPGVLRDVLFFREMIARVENRGIRDFMTLGMVNAAMRCSWALKDGAAVRTVKRPVPPFRRVLGEQLLSMISDLRAVKFKDSRAEVREGDARALDLEDSTVDAVITSPPYLQKREYLYEYRVEEWLAGVGSPDERKAIGSCMTDAGRDEPPPEAASYFNDMRLVMGEIHRVLKENGMACVVVSDACLQTGVLEVCLPLCSVAEEEGLTAKRMIVVNRRYCTTPSRKKLGLTKESLLILEKRG